MGKLDGAVAIITGGARGMGAEHVRGLVAEGAKVVVADILEQEGRDLATEIGANALFVKLDVTSDESWQAAVREAEAHFGPITILINNAGIAQEKPWLETTTAEWQRVIDINLTGAFIGMREVVPSMQRSGVDAVIINVSSVSGLLGVAGEPAYAASKWGMRALTKVGALEFAGSGIRVLSVHPGFIETPMTAGAPSEYYDSQPIPRMGQSAEVTSMIVFLAAEATFSTGSEFVVDGGVALGARSTT
nr:SDR family NAD(P)-dependent oxidoreductase [Aeromicrobium wangtongii]